jgi:hypothetical protein
MAYYKVPFTGFTSKKKAKYPEGAFIVTYPVSYRYNGGIVIGDEWYDGYEVDAPVVPEGWELKGMAVGLNLNARPPQATMLLKKVVA